MDHEVYTKGNMFAMADSTQFNLCNMGSKAIAGEEVECGRDEDVELDVWCYKDGQNKEWKN